MTLVRRTVVVVAMLAVVTSVFAQNPFQTQRQPAPQEIYRGTAPQFIRDWSRSLQQSIASLSRDVVEGRLGSIVPAFLLAVLFGVIHIVGPGHGKVFAISYFSGRDSRLRDGFLYSGIVNIVDSLAALALVILGYVALRTVLPAFRTQGPRILELVSYGLIALFGIVHLLSHVRTHHHDHADCDHGRNEKPERPPWLLALSVGLVPCPVSTILLVYGVANNVLPFMIFMVLGVTFGGFLTMSVLSSAVILGRTRVFARLHGNTGRLVGTVLEFAASGAIIIVGLGFFIARL